MFRIANKDDLARCDVIVRGLPDWFDAEDAKKIAKELREFPVYVYEIDNKIVGFVCINDADEKFVEMEYLAVDLDCRNKGIGSIILQFVEEKMANGKGIRVKTLDEKVDYEPYRQTRVFYIKHGFKKVKVIDNYPGWSPDCPCAVYEKVNR